MVCAVQTVSGRLLLNQAFHREINTKFHITIQNKMPRYRRDIPRDAAVNFGATGTIDIKKPMDRHITAGNASSKVH